MTTLLNFLDKAALKHPFLTLSKMVYYRPITRRPEVQSQFVSSKTNRRLRYLRGPCGPSKFPNVDIGADSASGDAISNLNMHL